jgi:spore coat polysaccharide biosynthesis predicted glycosyltransferase SpsG
MKTDTNGLAQHIGSPRRGVQWIKDIFKDRPIPRKVVFRVDAARIKGLSFGHLTRCIILAGLLKKYYNCRVFFLMKEYESGVNFAQNSDIKAMVVKIPARLSPAEEKNRVLKMLAEIQPDAFICDLPGLEPYDLVFPELRRRNIYSLFIDDTRFISPDADVVLNSSILASAHTWKKKGIKYFLGEEYFIIDETKIPKQRALKKEMKEKKILITFGGSDPSDLTYKAVYVLVNHKHKFNDLCFYIVLGPGYTNGKQIHQLIGSKNEVAGFHILHSPANMYTHFLESFLVICAGGRTLYELNHLKVPAFAIASIEHEKPVVSAFMKAKKLLDGLPEWENDAFYKKLTAYINFLEKASKKLEGSQ